MATTTNKYVSLEKLGLYDQKIKQYLADADNVALQSAKDYADEKVKALADGAVATNTANIADNASAIETLATKVDTLEKSGYDDTEVRGLITANSDAIDALEQTHTTDKGALEAAIALKADQTALDDVAAIANAAVKQSDYNTKIAALEAEDARIAGLVTAEAERAGAVEQGFETRIAKMEVFWDTTEDSDDVVNKLKEIQDYIAGDETGAAEMAGNIQANTQAIEGLDGRVGDLETASATHATKDEVTAVSDALNEYKTAHTGDYTNEQIDNAIQGAIDTEAERIDTELAKKVDKVDGKGLSTNDLTNDLKANYDAAYAHSQEAHAPANANANIIESVKVNGAALTVTDKAVDITVPTKVSELTNDVPYLVAADIAGKADKGTTLADYGITDSYTATEIDTAIADAMAQFEECTDDDIAGLFQ